MQQFIRKTWRILLKRRTSPEIVNNPLPCFVKKWEFRCYWQLKNFIFDLRSVKLDWDLWLLVNNRQISLFYLASIFFFKSYIFVSIFGSSFEFIYSNTNDTIYKNNENLNKIFSFGIEYMTGSVTGAGCCKYSHKT